TYNFSFPTRNAGWRDLLRTDAVDNLWRLAFKKLVPWATKRHRLNPSDAEEMVQDAIRQFLHAGGQADPENPKQLLQALGSRINGLAVNRRRYDARRPVTFS